VKSRIPEGIDLRLIYSPTREGNVLLEIAASRPPKEKFLAFEAVMGKQLHRRLVVYVVAAIWFALGTLLIVLMLWIPSANRRLCHD